VVIVVYSEIIRKQIYHIVLLKNHRGGQNLYSSFSGTTPITCVHTGDQSTVELMDVVLGMCPAQSHRGPCSLVNQCSLRAVAPSPESH
jgi:hypothetical protein